MLWVPKMLWKRRSEASNSLAWPSGEERPEIPTQCDQQPEIQLLYFSTRGTPSSKTIAKSLSLLSCLMCHVMLVVAHSRCNAICVGVWLTGLCGPRILSPCALILHSCWLSNFSCASIGETIFLQKPEWKTLTMECAKWFMAQWTTVWHCLNWV